MSAHSLKTVVKNMSVLFVSDVIRYLLSFIFTVYIARYLGTEGFGLLSFVVASMGILGVVIDLGINSLMVRDIAVNKELTAKYVGNVLLIKTFLSLAIFGTLFAILALGTYPSETVYVSLFIGLSVIVSSFTGIFTAVFQSHQKMQYQAIGEISRNVLMLVGAFLIISLQDNIVMLASSYLYVNLAVFIYSVVIVLWRFTRPKIEVDWVFWKQIFRNSLPIGGMAIFFLIYFRIDTVMLSFMKGDVAVGLYNAAYRLIDATLVIPTIVTTAMFPVLAHYHASNRGLFLNVYEKSFKFLLFLGLLMAVVVTLLSSQIIGIVFGDAFLESAGALQILIWASAALFLSSILGSVFIAANMQMVGLYINFITIFINVALNLLIIPSYGFIGASITTVISEIINIIICLYYLEKHGYHLGLKTVFLPAIIGLALIGGIIVVLSMVGISMVIIAAVSLVLYGLILFKFGIDKQDLLMLRKIFTIKKHNE